MSVLIATSAEEQSAVANEIATNLMEIRNQSHNVEQSANQSVSGCDELHATAEELDQLLVGLKNLNTVKPMFTINQELRLLFIT